MLTFQAPFSSSGFSGCSYCTECGEWLLMGASPSESVCMLLESSQHCKIIGRLCLGMYILVIFPYRQQTLIHGLLTVN